MIFHRQQKECKTITAGAGPMAKDQRLSVLPNDGIEREVGRRRTLLAALRRAGFHRVFIGIETPVEESLHEAQKSQNRGNLLKSVKKIQSYGIEVMARFIVGFDNYPLDKFSTTD